MSMIKPTYILNDNILSLCNKYKLMVKVKPFDEYMRLTFEGKDVTLTYILTLDNFLSLSYMCREFLPKLEGVLRNL